jgi:predicted nucleotidyltransferase
MIRTGRALPDTFDPRTLASIDARLDSIERDNEVRIGIAVESGSRAWGFPSPDSDYDCRFLFVRGVSHYLSPWQRRDVIETPIEDDLDINGWDLGKALKLLLKGNAVAIEWLTSPMVYFADAELKADLTGFASRHAKRESVGRHYLHLVEKQRRAHFADGKAVQLKKLFYALRPAAALRWLRRHPGASVAPMHFPTLMRECDPPPSIAEISAELMERKKVTRELGSAPLPLAIGAFIDAEFVAAADAFPSTPRLLDQAAIADAESIFRRSIERLPPATARLGGDEQPHKAP